MKGDSTCIVPLAPLLGAIVVGLFGWRDRPRGAHWVTILGMLRRRSVCSCGASFADVLQGNTLQRRRSTPG